MENFFFTFFTFLIRLHIMVSFKKSQILSFFIFLKKSKKIFGPLGHFLFLTHFEAKCVKMVFEFGLFSLFFIYIIVVKNSAKNRKKILTHFEAKCVKKNE
jgi:hypothetical protein